MIVYSSIHSSYSLPPSLRPSRLFLWVFFFASPKQLLKPLRRRTSSAEVSLKINKWTFSGEGWLGNRGLQSTMQANRQIREWGSGALLSTGTLFTFTPSVNMMWINFNVGKYIFDLLRNWIEAAFHWSIAGTNSFSAKCLQTNLRYSGGSASCQYCNHII